MTTHSKKLTGEVVVPATGFSIVNVATGGPETVPWAWMATTVEIGRSVKEGWPDGTAVMGGSLRWTKTQGGYQVDLVFQSSHAKDLTVEWQVWMG